MLDGGMCKTTETIFVSIAGHGTRMSAARKQPFENARNAISFTACGEERSKQAKFRTGNFAPEAKESLSILQEETTSLLPFLCCLFLAKHCLKGICWTRSVEQW